jgi:predicted lysophospholipase L1 biosynthesis ABC-type transport system permease subunit
MNEKNISPQETLAEIRHLMERSSRFISLSGLSGVFAGLYALAGAFAAYSQRGLSDFGYPRTLFYSNGALIFLLIDAALVLVLAVGTGIYLTTRKAKRDGNSIFDSSAKKLLINLFIPLAAGGLFCLALVYHGSIIYVPAVMLIFYGLALINASKYTRDDVRSLGLIEVLLGLLASFILGYGLMFWALGFGVMHIAYGIYMYLKYER